MEKLIKIVELLNGRGQVLVRNTHAFEGGKWYVHCWIEKVTKSPEDSEDIFCRHICTTEKDIYNQRVTDLDLALDEIIKILEVNYGR